MGSWEDKKLGKNKKKRNKNLCNLWFLFFIVFDHVDHVRILTNCHSSRGDYGLVFREDSMSFRDSGFKKETNFSCTTAG